MLGGGGGGGGCLLDKDKVPIMSLIQIDRDDAFARWADDYVAYLTRIPSGGA